MKKLYLVIPMMFALAACGAGEPSTSASGSKTSTPSTTTAPVGPVTADVTINLVASGIDTYEDNHSYIWINTDALGSAQSWGSKVMTQDEGNPNLWSVLIEDFELEQAISYNFVYGSETSPDWTNGKNVIEGEYSTIVTEEGKTSYDVTATFYVPEVSGTVDVRFSVNPKVVETAGGAELDLTEGVYVWAWNNLDEDTVVLEEQEDGTWLFAKDDVDLLDGKATVQLTCVLGSKFSPNWTYQQGAWEAGTWQPWNNGISFDFTTEEPSHSEDIYFNGQPVVSGYPLTISYYDFDDNPISDWSTSVWVNYSYTDPLMSGESSWIGNLSFDDETHTYSGTVQFTQKVYVEIQVWLGDATRHVGISTSKRFEVDFTAAEASFKVSVVYETLTDYYAGVVSETVGCTVA